MSRAARHMLAGMVCLLITGLVSGCFATSRTAVTEDQASAPADLSGTVVETLDAAGYTYVCLEKNGVKTWAAIPPAQLAVGQQVRLQPGNEMTHFHSSTLNRTFERIVFSGGLEGPKSPAVPRSAAAQKTAQSPQPPVVSGTVVETMSVGSYTYVLLEKDGRRGWSAIPDTRVSVGDVVELVPGVEMGTFTSSSLKRTFDGIMFSRGIKSHKSKDGAELSAPGPEAAPAAAMPPGHPPMPAPAKTP